MNHWKGRMLRFLAILLLAVALITTLTGQSIAGIAPVKADGSASTAVMSASGHEVISGGCDDDCPDSDGCCCPGETSCRASCSAALVSTPFSPSIQTFDRSSADIQVRDDDLDSVNPQSDPPIPRRST